MISSLLAFLGIFFLFKTTQDIMLYQMFKQPEEDQQSSPSTQSPNS